MARKKKDMPGVKNAVKLSGLHPKEKPGLRTNVYGQFTPGDPAK